MRLSQHFKFEIRLRAAFGVALIVFVALAASAWFAAKQANQAMFWVNHTHEVLARLAEAKADTLLIELYAQNYRLTGDPAHLAVRDAAIAARELALRHLKELTADNPRQMAHWAQLRAMVDERLAIYRRIILLRETEGTAAANAYAASAPVRETRERLFDTLHAMNEEEHRLLRQREADQISVLELRSALTIISLLLLAALLAATYIMIRRQLRETEASRRALAESEQNLATTLHSIGDAVLATDTEGHITRMNPVAERLTGWLSAEAQGRSVNEVFRIINEQTRAPAEVPVAKVLTTGEIQGLANHTVLIARDGSEWPIADSAAPIRDVTGQVSGVVLVFRDVSVERAAEKLVREQNELLEQRVRERTVQLRESEAQLQTVFENLAEGVVVADLDGRILQFNRAAIEMFGFTRSEEYLRRLPEFTDTLELSDLDGAILPLDQWPLARILRGETLHDLEIATRHLRDGWRKIFSYSGGLAHDANGRTLLAVVTIRDITGRKRAEQEILELNASLERRVAERTRQLEEASRAKSDFLANMSHELRTPLNSIIGFSEMLKDGVLGELDAKQHGFVTDIYDAGTHLLSLINDILDLSKVEAGMLQLEAEPVDLPALLQASTLVVREKAIAHRIRLDTRLDPGLSTMLADERKVKQIVYNLLANAVKFTPEGGTVTLAARRCSRSEVAFDETMPARLIALPPGDADEFLEITVEDNGVGIAEADLVKLFEPFTQVDSSATRRHAGTGLGLSLVRRLAELHGGTVGVASRPGVGSAFRVWLPYCEFAGTGAPAEPQVAATPAPRPALPLALVIEDDDRMADLIATQLHSEGFSVMRAATAEEGLVRAAKRRPDLITLDIFLPNMDGWECLRRLKVDPRLADTPVVIITISGDLGRGLALGARRVLQKPFAPEELAAAVTGLVAPHDGAAPCVLVVDDNVKAVERVATTLEAEGYRVLRAYSGDEAIAAARRERPDLLILDLMMPEVSGFEVASALRDSEQTARIPILVLTTRELSAEERARLNSQVSEILAKADFNRSALLAELRRALPGGGED
ncbi:MAG: response regulator [Pseudomonadota bacterium]